MDTDGIGVRQGEEVAHRAPVVQEQCQLLFNRVDGLHGLKVLVEDLHVLIALELEHPVPYVIDAATGPGLHPPVPPRIEAFLQLEVEGAYAGWPRHARVSRVAARRSSGSGLRQRLDVAIGHVCGQAIGVEEQGIACVESGLIDLRPEVLECPTAGVPPDRAQP
jgi:hypothetical protein